MRFVPIIFAALFACGCQTRGDLGGKVVQMVAQYGGHTRTTATIPGLSGRWSVQSADPMSFKAHLSAVSFADFEVFMQQVYGDQASTSVTVGHDWATPGHIYYRATDIGVAIEYYREWNGIGFKCHRGVHVTPL